LYAFCRVSDDLVDQADNAKDAELWISHLSQFLKVAYSKRRTDQQFETALTPFSPEARSVLILLPTDRLPAQPLQSLLDGFRLDLKFLKSNNPKEPMESTPINTEAELELYASRVAATVAELCLHLVYFHSPNESDAATKERCLDAGKRMGIALQYINIVRDVATDATDGRCYIPQDWFSDPPPSTAQAFDAELTTLRRRILDVAFARYESNRDAIEQLPEYARNGIRVAVESYVEIGRVMREKIASGQKLDLAGGGKEGRASVPKLRRLWVGWKTMLGPR